MPRHIDTFEHEDRMFRYKRIKEVLHIILMIVLILTLLWTVVLASIIKLGVIS